MAATKQPWERALSPDVYTEFQDRRVIIAGVGANNIGAALAEGFHALGAKVAIIGYDRDPLTKLADHLDEKAKAQAMPRTHRPDAFAADLTKEEARRDVIANIIASAGMPVAFVSTLGNDKRTPLAELSQDQLRTQASSIGRFPF